MRPTTTAKLSITLASLSLAAAVYLARTPDAHACGCFAPPDPSVPVVQAGERIAFAMKDGMVTAHVQIQYSGDAEQFAWLVPLPSKPEPLEVGTDELFDQLINTTQPKYRLNRVYNGLCPFDPSRQNFPTSGQDDSQAPPSEADGGGSPLVRRGIVGPYEWAELRADSKQAMLDWLDTNGFFVPDGTEDAVDPYIRTGAYFMALKLTKGSSVGDLQPVVIKYRSELPMIPIVLTSVAAEPDMGVLVWVVGDSRAIPRNYFHTHINDALIDWLNAGANYVDVITRAVDEADGHHSFVTEYAGTSGIMEGLLDPQGRFGDLTALAQITDAATYVQVLLDTGFASGGNSPPFFFPQFSRQIVTILQSELPMPSGLEEQGVTPNEYYVNMEYYLGSYREEHPELFTDLDVEFDPVTLTATLEERVVTPTIEAGRLFRENSYITRMFTTLSPEEMTKDPVFSFNPDLPDVSNIHEATLTYYCGVFGTDRPQGEVPAELVTEQEWKLEFPHGTGESGWLEQPLPASAAIEVLREEGPPELVTDNTSVIGGLIRELTPGANQGGCAVSSDRSGRGLAGMFLLGLATALLLRRRSR